MPDEAPRTPWRACGRELPMRNSCHHLPHPALVAYDVTDAEEKRRRGRLMASPWYLRPLRWAQWRAAYRRYRRACNALEWAALCNARVCDEVRARGLALRAGRG